MNEVGTLVNDWEPSGRERLVVAAAGLDWTRALLRRSRSQLEHVPRERMQPLVDELTAIHERLAGLQHLIEAIYLEER